MIPFDYRHESDPEGAVAAVSGRPGAAFLAGGTNLVDHMKLGVASPDLLVDITRLPLDRVEETADGGLRIGATVRNSELAANPLVTGRYRVLSQALLAGASGQLRNAATTGGNLLQRTRCSYFQDVTTPCNKREPDSGCSARAGVAHNHAVLGVSEHCVATHPSDMAVAMAALEAQVEVLGPEGPRVVPVRDLHRLPGSTPHLDTTLAHGELITAVTLPPPAAGARSSYRKVRERASYAFALVSVAAVVELHDHTVADIRIALGGVAHKPWRATRAESELRGRQVDEQALVRAADAELVAADPLDGTRWKVPLVRRTLVATVRDLVEEGSSDGR